MRYGATSLFAALDIASGQVFTQRKPRYWHQEFLSFLRHLGASVPNNLDVHRIVDYYATHKHERVRAWLARWPRFQVHYTPTYSYWLNQIEHYLKLSTQRAIRRGSLSLVTDLRCQIERLVAGWNRHPKRFVWTAAATSILAKVERLGKVICGTQYYAMSADKLAARRDGTNLLQRCARPQQEQQGG